MLRFAESLLRDLGGLILVGGVDFDRALADLALVAVFAKYVLHELNNKPWHRTLPRIP
jgi:uncharacterized membrane protein